MEHIDERTAAQRAEELSDEELIALSRSGETWAEEALCERHKNLVRIKARPYFLIGADREDLLQEGMIGLYENPGRRTGRRVVAAPGDPKLVVGAWGAELESAEKLAVYGVLLQHHGGQQEEKERGADAQ